MVITITRWGPDTCGCVMDYSWDTASSPDTRVHTFSRVEKKCPEHTQLTDSLAYDACLDENKRKNILRGELVKRTDIAEDKVRDGEDTFKDFKTGIIYDWRFDVDRKLEVRILGTDLPVNDKNSIQATADALFGVDKVVIL